MRKTSTTLFLVLFLGWAGCGDDATTPATPPTTVDEPAVVPETPTSDAYVDVDASTLKDPAASELTSYAARRASDGACKGDCKDCPSKGKCKGDCEGCPSKGECKGDCASCPSKGRCEGDCERCASKQATASTEQPACLCAQGKAGEPVWCDACDKGYVDGKPAGCKGCVAEALKARANAKAGE